MLDALKSVLLHLSGHLRSEDQARLLRALDSALDGVRTELVGGLALIDASVFSKAVQNVKDDNAEVMESPEAVTSWKRFAILEPLNLIGKKFVSF